jgi:MurNAc alpha-1-phosphate uridylyltransferase
MKAMLLAAGRGERMGALTRDLPKPLLEVGGERLIDRQLRLLAQAGVDQVVVNLSYLGDAIRDHIGTTSAWGQTVVYSDEGEPPLETAGGIVRALPLLGDAPFIVANADVYTDFDYLALRRTRAANLLVLVPNPDHHPEGDFGLEPSGVVTRTPPLLTYGGMALLCPSLFAGVAAGYRKLRPILEAAIDRRAISGLFFGGIWEDVGTPDRLAELRSLVAG